MRVPVWRVRGIALKIRDLRNRCLKMGKEVGRRVGPNQQNERDFIIIDFLKNFYLLSTYIHTINGDLFSDSEV